MASFILFYQKDLKGCLIPISYKHVPSFLCAVWVLYATHCMQLHLRECNKLEYWNYHHCIRQLRLLVVGQQSVHPLLQLRVMQGRGPRKPKEGLEEGCYHKHHRPHLPHHRLLCWVLRVQEQ